MSSQREKPLLVLIDGHGIIHRAWHAVREPLVVRHSGEVVTATYGFTNTLLKVLNELQPTHVVVALDKGNQTFRHQQDVTYKAHRPETPADLRSQFARVRQIIEAFNIPIYEHESYEADDIIGTLAKQAAQQSLETYLVTLDSDFAQLVQPGVTLYMYRPYQRDTVIYDEQGVLKRYGVHPKQIPDLKGLKGDPSDNIPGVPGVGEKTAVKLLQTYGSLKGVYQHLEEIAPERLREMLRAHQAQALRSKEMATIVTDVPVELDLAACELGGYDQEKVLGLFRELEFRSLVPRLPTYLKEKRPEPRPGPVAEGRGPCYEVVETWEKLERLAQRIAEQRSFVFDTETTDLNPLRGLLVGIAISLQPEEAFYIPVGHVPSRNGRQQLLPEQVLKAVGPLFEDEGIEKVAHNGKYDIIMMAREGVWTRNLAFDTLIAAYLLGEGGGNGGRPGEGALNLKWLASKRLGVEMTPITQLIGTGRQQLSMSQVDIDAAAAYACADADMTGRLRQVLEGELKQQNMWRLFTEVEMPLVPLLAKMEMTGVALDVGILREMSKGLAEEIGRIAEEIYSIVGHRFNIGSTQQLGSVLFEELGLPKTRRTKLGYSTDAQSLEALRGVHPIINLILDYRQLTKIKSTYVDALPALINPQTGRLHTSFNQTATATGRLSSSDPNLQNIPVRGEMGGQVRRAFIARDIGPDPWLLSADYSQIELRILAHICQDPGLLEAFHSDQDIHAATAAQVFGVAADQVTPAMRRRAKVFNFGVLYGLTPYGLSTREGISTEEAAQFIETYFGRYPGIQRYIQETIQRTRELGYAETLIGRRRYLPEINSSNVQVRQAAERMAINMPIQGTASDIIKIAMVNIDREMQRRGLRSRMTLQVHDELIFECPASEMEEMKALVQEIMPRSLELSVPLKVDLKVGKNWGEME